MGIKRLLSLLLAGVLVIIAVAVLWIGAPSYADPQRSARAPGKVTSVIMVGKRRSVGFHAEVRFTTADGHTFEFLNDAPERSDHRQVGESVTVLYDPHSPRDAVIYDNTSAILVKTMAAVLLGFAVLLVLVPKRNTVEQA